MSLLFEEFTYCRHGNPTIFTQSPTPSMIAEIIQHAIHTRRPQLARKTLLVQFIASSKRDGDGRMLLNLKGGAKSVAVSRAYQHLFRHMS